MTNECVLRAHCVPGFLLWSFSGKPVTSFFTLHVCPAQTRSHSSRGEECDEQNWSVALFHLSEALPGPVDPPWCGISFELRVPAGAEQHLLCLIWSYPQVTVNSVNSQKLLPFPHVRTLPLDDYPVLDFWRRCLGKSFKTCSVPTV